MSLHCQSNARLAWGEKCDIDTVRGQTSVTGAAGNQAGMERIWWSGNANGLAGTALGSTLEAMFTAHSVTSTNVFRYIEKTETKIKIVNMTNAPVKTRLYIVQLRKQWTVGSATSPLNTWQEYLNEYDLGGFDQNTLDSTPYQAYGFGNCFKIVKDKTIHLDAGEVHTVTIRNNVRRNYSRANEGQNIEASTMHFGVKDLTHGIMVVGQGILGSDTTTPANLNTTEFRLGMTWVTKIWSAPALGHESIVSGLLTNSTDALAGSAQNIIVDETGVAAVVDVV